MKKNIFISMAFLIASIFFIFGCGQIAEQSGVNEPNNNTETSCRSKTLDYSGLNTSELEVLNNLRSIVPENYWPNNYPREQLNQEMSNVASSLKVNSNAVSTSSKSWESLRAIEKLVLGNLKNDSAVKITSVQSDKSSIDLEDLFWNGTIKKGDLIFSKTKNADNNKSFPYGYWGHVGFAFDYYHAYESHPKTEELIDQQNGGVGKRLYEKWQEAYDYMAVARYRFSSDKGYSDTATVLDYAINTYNGRPYPLIEDFLTVLLHPDGLHYKEKGIVCSQLVGLSFEEAPGWGVDLSPADDFCGDMFLFPDDIYFGRKYIGYDAPMNFEVIVADSGATPEQ